MNKNKFHNFLLIYLNELKKISIKTEIKNYNNLTIL